MLGPRRGARAWLGQDKGELFDNGNVWNLQVQEIVSFTRAFGW